MYFLLDACQHPGVLRALYFAIIARDILFTIIPIGIIAMTIIDFSKAVIADKEDEQAKAVKLIPKRLMYAVIVFSVPWVVTITMKTLEGLKFNVAMDYNTCIHNAEESEGKFTYYDDLLKAEEEAEAIESSHDNDDGNSGNTPGSGGGTTIVDENPDLQSLVSHENCIRQGGQSWSNHPLCASIYRNSSTTSCTRNDERIIGGSGCGFCSLTMVLRSFGYTSLTPDKVVDQVCSVGAGCFGTAAPSDFSTLMKSSKYDYSKQNFKSEVDSTWYCTGTDKTTLNNMFAKYKRYLKEGKRLIINIPGHYIAVLGIRNDDTLYISDSNQGSPGSGYWRGFNWIGPYDIIPLNYKYRNDFINNDILRTDSYSIDLSAYKNSSKNGHYTIETLFYITATSYVKYNGGEFPCWKNVTAIWKD